MKQFLSDDFLLQTETARRLYFDYAKDMPVIDYHNHLPPDEIASDKTFANMTEIWLKGDHYKWRAMRANGVAEDLITGNADDFTKFRVWAETVPFTARNPSTTGAPWNWRTLSVSAKRSTAVMRRRSTISATPNCRNIPPAACCSILM